MAFTRPFAYNPTQDPISGTEPYGTLVVGTEDLDYSKNPGGLKWWMGPDEELGYIIGGVVSGGTQPSPVGDVGTVRFWRTSGLNSAQFVSIANKITGQNFTSANEAKTWLDANNYYASYEDAIAPGYYFAGGFYISDPQTYSGMIAFREDGYLDTSISLSTGFTLSVECVTVDSNDKIIAGGFFRTYNGNTSAKLIRLNSDGSFDSTFDVGSIGFSGTGSIYVYDVLALSDNKVIAVGNFTTYKGTSANRIVKLNTDGSIDTTFVYGSGFDQNVGFVDQLSNGKIIACGNFTLYNSETTNKIAILNTDGTKDTSFVPEIFNGNVASVIEQSDGKLIAIGGFTTYSGLSYDGIVRLNTDGSIDNTFVVGTGFGTGSPIKGDIQSDGKIIIGGSFTSYQGVSTGYIVRLNPDGSIDNTFNSGIGFSATVYKVEVLPNGKIYVGGNFMAYNSQKAVSLVRLNSDGSIDNTFNRDKSFYQRADDFVINSNNSIIAVRGNIYGYITGNAVKFGYDGAINIPYINNLVTNNSIETVLKSSDGKIYYGGNFNRYGGVTTVVNRILRLNYDGSRDTSFLIGTGFDNTVNRIYEDNNGKIVVGGSFTTYDGINIPDRICRLNTDGSVDTSFVSVSGFNNSVDWIIQDSNGKYLVVGTFTTYNGVTANRIARLNYDGSLDTTFNTGSGFNNNVYCVIALSSGKYMVSGAFITYNGVSANRIIRLNSDGTRDASFVYGTGFNQQIWSIVEQSDGKVVAGGIVSSYNGTACKEIVRLNTDGTLDNTFSIGTGLSASGLIYDMKLTPEGKILIGGIFRTINGISAKSVGLLNSDGSVDTSFNCAGVDNIVYSVDMD